MSSHIVKRLCSTAGINITILTTIEENREDASTFTVTVERLEAATGRLNPHRDFVAVSLQHGAQVFEHEPSFLSSDRYVVDGVSPFRLKAKRGERSLLRVRVNGHEQVDPMSGTTEFSIIWV